MAYSCGSQHEEKGSAGIGTLIQYQMYKLGQGKGILGDTFL